MELNQSRSILIVEDDHSVRDVLEKTISNIGIEVQSAKNGKEGLELIKSHHFNAMLVDLNMPVMNGIKMLNEIRKLAIETPCVILTGEGESELILQALRLGAIDFLSKPAVLAKVKETVMRAIDIGHRMDKIKRDTELHDSELAKKIQHEQKMIWLMRVFNNDENLLKEVI